MNVPKDKCKIGNLLAKENDFVEFHGENFKNLVNPFEANGKPLKNVPKKFIESLLKNEKNFNTEMANYIEQQRKRIGGDFVVVQEISKKDSREKIKQILPDCVFVNLIGKETKNLEKCQKGEENTFDVEIEDDMTDKNVKNKVLTLI